MLEIYKSILKTVDYIKRVDFSARHVICIGLGESDEKEGLKKFIKTNSLEIQFLKIMVSTRVVKFPGIYSPGNISGNISRNIPGNISKLEINGNKWK